MFINLGEDYIIRMSDVVAILNYESLIESGINKKFFERLKKQKQIIKISDEIVKSIVVTSDSVFFTPFSTATLRKRSELSLNQL